MIADAPLAILSLTFRGCPVSQGVAWQVLCISVSERDRKDDVGERAWKITSNSSSSGVRGAALTVSALYPYANWRWDLIMLMLASAIIFFWEGDGDEESSKCIFFALDGGGENPPPGGVTDSFPLVAGL